jgi:hypothetical protein
VDVILNENDQIVLTYWPGKGAGFTATHIVHEREMDTYHVVSTDGTRTDTYNQMWRGNFKSCLGWLQEWITDLESDFRYEKAED